MTDSSATRRRVHLCPGSHTAVSSKPTGPGLYTCLDCHRFVGLLKSGRLAAHRREFDRHTPYTDDGVTYCGWWGDLGIFDGCGKLWPCSGGVA